MKTVTVIASPRKRGNCSALVDYMTEEIAANGGKNSAYFVDDMDIKPCQACASCRDVNNPSKCVIDDDFNRIMDEVEKSDAFIFAAPNYFGEINAQGHIFMDRFYSLSKSSPNTVEGYHKAVVIYTYGAPTGSCDEYINKRAKIFESIGLDVVEVLSVGDNLPTRGDNREIKQKVKDAARKLF